MNADNELSFLIGGHRCLSVANSFLRALRVSVVEFVFYANQSRGNPIKVNFAVTPRSSRCFST
jgi:hypothetical protein